MVARRSGIVDEYLKVLTATPAPPPSSDLLVTVPNVLHALCLTHDGASRVQEANVFPAVRVLVAALLLLAVVSVLSLLSYWWWWW